MKQLKFNHGLAGQIVSGSKTSTIRINDDKSIVVGDQLEVVDKVKADEPTTWQIIGVLKVLKIEQNSLGEVSDSGEFGNESYDSPEILLATFRRYYGDFVNYNTPVKNIHFEFQEYQNRIPFIAQNLAIKSDLSKVESLKLFADGGSRGNPGPSALGYAILDNEDRAIYKNNKYLGITTNNQAEYQALIKGLEYCKGKTDEIKVFMDSLLVINQMKGIYKVRNRDLWPLYEKAKTLSKAFKKISFTHVPRELNKLADAEVNIALDSVKGDEALQ
jgi:ribonuclease HI